MKADVILLAALGLLVALPLDSSVRRRPLSQMGKPNELTKEQLKPEVRDPEIAQGLTGREFKTQDWQPRNGQTSRLNDLQSKWNTGENAFSTQEIEHKDYGFRQARVTTSNPRTPEGENYRDWNVVRETVMAHRYDQTRLLDLQTTELREGLDDVSIDDINRFASVRNTGFEGIPAQEVGSEEGTITIQGASDASEQMSTDTTDSLPDTTDIPTGSLLQDATATSTVKE